jgi:hypothetical protein
MLHLPLLACSPVGNSCVTSSSDTASPAAAAAGAAAGPRRYVAEGGDWRKSYYMPTRADAAIMAMRKWMDKHAGGGIPFPEHMQVTCTTTPRPHNVQAP